MNPPKAISLLNLALYLIFFASLIGSFRAITSISIGLILLTGLIINRTSLLSLYKKSPAIFFMTGCFLFFLLQIVSLLYTHDRQEGWDHVRLKSGLLLTPLAFYCSGYINSKTAGKLFFYFSLLLALASIYCFVIAFSRYQQSGELSLFFYHQLVSPLKQHAVYFSIFVFVALVFLMESLREKKLLVKHTVYIGLVIYFSILLFFLSSKLVLVFFVLYMLYFFASSFRNSGRRKLVSLGLLILFALSLTVALTTSNPVSNRFSEIVKGNMALVGKEKYTPADSFNGLQFRLLQWKFVPEILSENRAWLEGMSPGDAQSALDRQYALKNMYIGETFRKDRGFLGYNTHNQFLQALLQNGIIGLLVFLFSCFFLIKMTLRIKKAGPVFIILLLLTYALAESVLETQYGIIIFTIFPLWLYWGRVSDPYRGV
jgi:O-antigen ligase